MPAGWVQRISVIVGGGIVEDIFNPSLYAFGSFVFFIPDGLDDSQDIVGRDLLDRFVADNWPGVDLEATHPLPGVLGVTPAVAMYADVTSGTGDEGRRTLLLGLTCLLAQSVVLPHRIKVIERHVSVLFSNLFSCFIKVYILDAAQSYFPLRTV
ncbi:MAG: hypothetical protein KZQ60_18640 [Candidatus Thiodiazotropha sp. (ex Lucinoma aequizonata)]|nr:hypothetical protein [Candidatus Thiodiazotropha sp. (ex Lucinoma aequizonata)]MCU7898455.1 hypothetical protein [Candidatus Thiodiazotropha sp. (ex Lucinoma aequizonata)]